MYVFIFLRYIPRNRFNGTCDRLFDDLPNCFPKQLNHFTFPPAIYAGFFISPHPHQYLLLFVFDYSHSNRCEVVWSLVTRLILPFPDN